MLTPKLRTIPKNSDKHRSVIISKLLRQLKNVVKIVYKAYGELI